MTAMLPPPVVLLPFVLALLPAALPTAVTARRLNWCAVVLAAATAGLLFWSALPAAGAAWLDGSTGPWRTDPLGRVMALLPSLSWLLVSVRGLHPGEMPRAATGRWRRWPVAAQLATACAAAACRADLLALLPVLVGGLLLLCGRLDGEAVDRSPWLAAVPVAAIGVAILSAASGAPARWGSLPSASPSVPAGLLLLLAPLLLVSAASLLRPVLRTRFAPLRGLLRLLWLPPTLCVALRACDVAPSIAAVLMPVGIGWIVLTLLLLPSCRGLAQRVSLAAALQGGVVVLAVAAGGTGGIAAALMLAGFLALLLPVALWLPGDAAASRLRDASVAAMVGLPPFGPFAAGLVLLVRLWSTRPALALFVLAAALLSVLSVLDALGREPAHPAGFRPTPWAASVLLVLAAALWLGLAMPTALSDRLLAIGGGRP